MGGFRFFHLTSHADIRTSQFDAIIRLIKRLINSRVLQKKHASFRFVFECLWIRHFHWHRKESDWLAVTMPPPLRKTRRRESPPFRNRSGRNYLSSKRLLAAANDSEEITLVKLHHFDLHCYAAYRVLRVMRPTTKPSLVRNRQR